MYFMEVFIQELLPYHYRKTSSEILNKWERDREAARREPGAGARRTPISEHGRM